MRSKLTACGKMILGACLLSVALAWSGPAQAASQAELEKKIEMLQQSLTDLKGQLNQLQDTQKQQASQIQTVKAAPAGKLAQLPAWLERTSIFGDFRLRYENTHTDDFKGKATDSRDRWRYRLRVGVKSQVTDDLLVAMRMASGADNDATSTNETMTNWFSEKSWGIDQAYVKYNPAFLDKVVTAWGGKLPNPYETTNIMWDSDVVPEGAALNFQFNKKGMLRPFITLGAFSVEEQKKDDPGDAYLFAPQAGLEFVNGPWKIKAATSYYDWSRFSKNGNYPTDLRGNIAKANKDLVDFGVWDLYAKASYKLTDKASLALWGQYMVNTKEDLTGAGAGKDKGYDFGVGLTYAKFSLSADYKMIEANATPGYFADSDFGFANRKGYVVSGKYKIFKYTTAQLTYYSSQAEDDKLTGATADYQMVHADLIFEY
ncbi:MAG: putative porin [Pseudomonadota bacterium]